MKVTVDFENIKGKIKPMHAVGQPPFKGGFSKFDFSPMGVLKDAHIPYSRLHDVGGPFGGNRFVDIPNIFRDFDADENDPASYDFWRCPLTSSKVMLWGFLSSYTLQCLHLRLQMSEMKSTVWSGAFLPKRRALRNHHPR